MSTEPEPTVVPKRDNLAVAHNPPPPPQPQKPKKKVKKIIEVQKSNGNVYALIASFSLLTTIWIFRDHINSILSKQANSPSASVSAITNTAPKLPEPQKIPPQETKREIPKFEL